MCDVSSPEGSGTQYRRFTDHLFPDVTATLALTCRKREHQKYKYPFGVIAASGAELWLKSLRIGSIKCLRALAMDSYGDVTMIFAVFRTRPKS